MIVVRETNGTLRKAINDEREKVLQVYFPRKGKSNYVPPMFDKIQIEVHLIEFNTILSDLKNRLTKSIFCQKRNALSLKTI